MHPDEDRSTPAELGASGSEPAHEVYFKETVHGPVQRNRAGERRSRTRSPRTAPTRGREPAGELAFSRPRLRTTCTRRPTSSTAANELETTFNMAYLDSKNIAYFSTGLLPMLAPGTDPSLPTLGHGRVRLERLPHPGRTPARKRSRRRPVPELERQAGTRMGRGLQRMLVRARSSGCSCYTGFGRT